MFGNHYVGYQTIDWLLKLNNSKNALFHAFLLSLSLSLSLSYINMSDIIIRDGPSVLLSAAAAQPCVAGHGADHLHMVGSSILSACSHVCNSLTRPFYVALVGDWEFM